MDFFNIKETILKYTENKKRRTIIVIFLIGFLLVCMSSFSTNKKSEPKAKNDPVVSYEEKLKEMLLAVDGIKKVKVMICFFDGGVKEYYKNESENRDDINIKIDNKMVITRKDGNEMPVLKRELNPEIKGVSIVANCSKKGLEDTIYTLTSKGLGVEIHKIEVIINDRS